MEINLHIESTYPMTRLIFPFFVSVNNFCFPSDDWEDFAIEIVSDWIDVLCENRNQITSDFKLFFMDGPYYILCHQHHSMVRITGHHLDQKQIYFQQTISTNELEKVIIDTGMYILNQSRKLLVDNSEFVALTSSIKRYLQR